MSGRDNKLINRTETCVDESLQGLVALNPGMTLLQGHRVVVRADIEQVKAAGKVTVISGGGSGHEPMAAGFVGSGALSGSVAGSVFTSPPPSSILAATQAVGQGNPAGTLQLVLSYTGDRLNFGMAAERAKALGLAVETVVIGEDCALTSADKTAGRRGLSGCILLYKIAGAMAEEGRSLQEIKEECQAAVNDMGTIGLSLSPCSVPGTGASFQLPADEMELGLGVHGEAGVRRLKVMPAKESVAAMLAHMTNPESSTRLKLQSGDKVALLVNNLGGTSTLEMNVVAKEALEWLEAKGVSVDRAYCGSFMTSLEMAGVLLTVMHLTDDRRRHLDAPTSCPGWVKPYLPSASKVRCNPEPMACPQIEHSTQDQASAGPVLDPTAAARLQKAVQYACQAISNCTQQLNILDTSSGDGDCGTTLKRGADAAHELVRDVAATTNPATLMLKLANIGETTMGGCSGAFYSLMLTAAAGVLRTDASANGWGIALKAAVDAVERYGGADRGDRTMLDALFPAQQTLQAKLASGCDPMEAFGAAAQAAQDGASATTPMKARAGRASYVSEQLLTQPDPGAHAVGIWMRAAYEACKI